VLRIQDLVRMTIKLRDSPKEVQTKLGLRIEQFEKLKLEYKHYRAVKGNKSKARDAAFKLLHLILLSDFKDETKDSAKVFNAVLFVMSHSSTFKWRTRCVVRAAYEERFVPSVKQRASLDQWEKGRRR
jgi:hypothetical protein